MTPEAKKLLHLPHLLDMATLGLTLPLFYWTKLFFNLVDLLRLRKNLVYKKMDRQKILLDTTDPSEWLSLSPHNSA